MTRDLSGYGRTPPDPKWPGGARVAVSFVINFEEGAEMSLSSGDELNEKVYEVTDEVVGVPDRCMESHFEYGTKAAWWRIADTLERLGVATTVSTCGQAAELSPWLIQDAVKRGHEISCHGWRWEKHAHMDEAAERTAIARTVKVLTEIAGTRPVGWHTRSTPSPNTRRLLVEEGGFLYDSDDYSDDLPFFVEVSGKRHLVLPYGFDTNDMKFFNLNGFVTPSNFSDYVSCALDTLLAEAGRGHSSMLTIGFHLRICGRPARFAAVESILAKVAQCGDRLWVARRRDIAEHFLRAGPPS